MSGLRTVVAVMVGISQVLLTSFALLVALLSIGFGSRGFGASAHHPHEDLARSLLLIAAALPLGDLLVLRRQLQDGWNPTYILTATMLLQLMLVVGASQLL